MLIIDADIRWPNSMISHVTLLAILRLVLHYSQVTVFNSQIDVTLAVYSIHQKNHAQDSCFAVIWYGLGLVDFSHITQSPISILRCCLNSIGISIIKMRPSHLYNWNSHTGKMSSLYWNRALDYFTDIWSSRIGATTLMYTGKLIIYTQWRFIL